LGRHGRLQRGLSAADREHPDPGTRRLGGSSHHDSGLLVAIPCLFGYNLLLASTKRLITELENYASSLADRIELETK